MNDSKLTKSQVRIYGPVALEELQRKPQTMITATVRYDDPYNNGYNAFSITASTSDGRCGQLHDEVAIAFPALAGLIRYHLVASNGPIHYIPNTLYWLGYYRNFCDGAPNRPPNLENARRVAVWPELTDDFYAPHLYDSQWTQSRHDGAVARVTKALSDRLPSVLQEFRSAIESIGFIW